MEGIQQNINESGLKVVLIKKRDFQKRSPLKKKEKLSVKRYHLNLKISLTLSPIK